MKNKKTITLTKWDPFSTSFESMTSQSHVLGAQLKTYLDNDTENWES